MYFNHRSDRPGHKRARRREGLRLAYCAWQHGIVRRSKSCYQPGPRSGPAPLAGAGHGDTDAAFPRGKPSSDQRRSAQHLGDGALPRCRHHERTGAPRVPPCRYERRGLDDASRGLGRSVLSQARPVGQRLAKGAATRWNRKKRTRKSGPARPSRREAKTAAQSSLRSSNAPRSTPLPIRISRLPE